MIVSALAFALLNVFVKNLNHFNVYQIVFFRSTGTLLFTIPLLIKSKIPILGNQKGLLIARGIIGCTAMTLFFISLKYLKTGTAVSIRYISPIFGALFAIFLLKERTKYWQWLCFAVAFLGVIILKGFDNNIDNLGLLYIILSAIFTGLVYVIIRMISHKDHPLVVVNYFMIIAAVFGGILMLYHWQTPNLIDGLLLISLGVFGFFGQYYMTKAIQLSEVNQIAPLKYIEVIFTMIIGVVWMKESYTLIGVLGIILIVVGLTLNIVLKNTKKEKF